VNSVIKASRLVVFATLLTSANLFADGQSDYKTICFACHDSGAAGAPKVGDNAVWEARIAKGMDALYDSVTNPEGFKGDTGFMPPRGGSQLDDAALKAVVDFMVEQSQ
jgi:cytochrome c5